MLAVNESAKLATSGLPSRGGSRNDLAIVRRCGPENAYLGKSAGADCRKGRGKWEKLKGRSGTSLADSPAVLLIFDGLWRSKGLGVADARRKPQTVVEISKPRETSDSCRNQLCHLLSPLRRSPTLTTHTPSIKGVEVHPLN